MRRDAPAHYLLVVLSSADALSFIGGIHHIHRDVVVGIIGSRSRMERDGNAFRCLFEGGLHRALQLFREGDLSIEEKLHDALHLVFRHVIARNDHGTHTHGLRRFALSCVGVGRDRAGRVIAVALGEHIHRERVDREHAHADAIGQVGDRWGRDSGRDERGIDLAFLHRLGGFGEAPGIPG